MSDRIDELERDAELLSFRMADEGGDGGLEMGERFLMKDKLMERACELATIAREAIADNHRLTERNTALEAVVDALRDTPPYTQEYAGGGYTCKLCGCSDTRPSSYWAKAHAEWVPHESDCPFAALAELDALCAAQKEEAEE